MKLRIRLPKIPALDATVWAAVAVAVGVGAAFFVWLINGPDISVRNERSGDSISSATSSLTGLPCADPLRRPVAVMLASDTEARPLSGLQAADMFFEMPVTPNGITRLMAVYQCHDPEEVGSIRSARFDFIPLVQGLDALYAHWGGERDALELLDRGATDNVDALKYEGTVYFRKSGIPRPHNGFTTVEAVREKAGELGYRATASLDSYAHTKQSPERNLAALITEAAVDWPQGFDVSFRYDTETNTYLRWRNDKPEIDRTTDAQVAVSVVVVLDTETSPKYGQYISVRTTGQGKAALYQNGRRTEVVWKKPTAADMLSFTDSNGSPVALAPGKIWVLYNPELP